MPGALERLRALREPARSPAERERPSARGRGSGQSVRRGDPLAPPRRGRPAAAAAGGRRLRRPRRRGRRALPRARRRDAPDPARRGRRRGRRGRGPRARGLLDDRRVRELVITKVDGLPGRRVAVPRATDRGGLQSRLPRAHAARPSAEARAGARGRHALPDGGRAAAAPRRPDRDGGAGSPAGPTGRAGRRGRRSRRSNRRARTC